MINELIKNTGKYFWTSNKDGDLVLGNSDLGLKAKVTFTLTPKWVNIAPIVEKSPGQYIGHSETFLKKSDKYKQVSKLYKLAKEFMGNVPKSKRDQLSKNTLHLLHDYYNA